MSELKLLKKRIEDKKGGEKVNISPPGVGWVLQTIP
jgi:hypothetical protein